MSVQDAPKIDTSPEAVEARAKWLELFAGYPSAALLRAVAAERDAALALLATEQTIKSARNDANTATREA